MGLAANDHQDDEGITSVPRSTQLPELPTSAVGGVNGTGISSTGEQYSVSTLQHLSTVACDRRAGDGNATTEECRESGTGRSFALSTCRQPATTAKQWSLVMVDVHSMRQPLAKKRVPAACSTWNGAHDDWTASKCTFPEDTIGLSAMGHQGKGGTWRWHASAVGTICRLGAGAGNLEKHTGDCTSYLVGNTGEHRGRGHGVHTSSTTRGSIGKVRSRTIVHELQQVVLPQQRRLQQKQFGENKSDARGMLLGLYTRQGGTGITRATSQYPYLVQLLTGLGQQMGWQFTSIQVNILDAHA
eukprot:6492224-Amphidinium_carterae.1